MQYSVVPLAAGLAAALAFGASAQETPSSYDPDQLPTFHGEVQFFTLTPRGDIDGLILRDGSEIKTPPHLSTQIALAVRPGDPVTIHGLKAAKLLLIQAVSVTNDRDGKTVVDRGPGPFASFKTDPVGTRIVTGQIRMPLHGLRGEVNGVLLQDGTVLKLAPPELERFASLLNPGRNIAVGGNTRVTVAGTVVEVTALGTSPETLQPVE